MYVKFENDYRSNKVKVFMFEDSGSSRVFFKADGSSLILEEGTFMKDEEIVYCLIPNNALKAFADALSEFGVKTDNDHKIAGTLEATKYHLEDMRVLAKVTNK